MTWAAIAGGFAAAAGAGAAAAFGVRGLARRLGIVAHGDPIIVQHSRPVAYMGGVAVLLGIAAAAGLARPAGADVLLRPWFLIPAVAYLLLGLVDDLRVFSVRRKFVLQVIVAAGAVALGLRSGMLADGPLNAAFCVLWVVTLVNAFNFVDVADGQAAGLSAVAFAAAGALDPRLAVAGAIVAGACAGFLVFNFPPATMFLGDAGSHLLGFAAAAFSLTASSPRWPAVAAWALLLGVFLFELAFVSWVRVRKGIAPWRGSPDHFSLRLRAAGFTRRGAALVAWSVAAVLALMAATLPRLGPAAGAGVAAAAIVMAVAAGRWLLPHEVRGRELGDEAGATVAAWLAPAPLAAEAVPFAADPGPSASVGSDGAHAPDRPIRLVYVTRLAFTHWQFLRGQNGYLRERGFELHAVAGNDDYLRAVGRRDGVRCHPVYVSPRAFAPVQDLRAILHIYRLLRRLRPDIVHLSAPKPAFLGAVAAWMARVPVRVFFARGSATATAGAPLRSLWRLLERATARLCTDAVVVSPSLRDFFHRERILPAGSGFVPANGGSNGVDVGRFSPGPVPAGGLTVGYVGRLAAGKGIDTLADAWARVRVAVPDARLLLVGRWDGDHPVAPETRAALESDPRVEIRGHVDDVVPCLRSLSVAVFPSRGEGLPNAVLEAQAVGLPVVGCRVVGVVDAVEDGVTGTLVAPGDAGMLAAALARYLGDAGLRRRHGYAGRHRVAARFSQEPIWEAMCAHYRALARRSLPCPPQARPAGPAAASPQGSG